ncbi:MAG: glycerophosphodiester phosphodiesterase family protein [Paraprevotella sp.]|nr:glycerophosphodiester phosphodiesterase family protein [Paraprevotella sp.]
MKKFVFVMGFLCLSLYMQASGRIGRLRAALKDCRSDYVFVVCHRGDWRHAPENTVKAIEGAADMGADMVEIDIQKTRDGQFVLMHDDTIDRMTEGKGRVADYTVDELKQFRMRRSDGTWSDERIPTLEEALSACKGRLLVNIDKGGDYFAEIEPIIRSTGTEDHVVLKGRNTVENVACQLAAYSDILYMPVVDLDAEGAIPYVASFLSSFRPAAVEVSFRTDKFAKLAYLPMIPASGSRIWINTLWESLCGGHDDEKAMVDPEANWGWVLDWGTSIIQTDRPKELISFLKLKGRCRL